MKRSIAIWPSLNGEVRLAAEGSGGESVWRNGGHHGNGPVALQADDEHDTLLLGTILAYFEGRYQAKPLMISHTVVVLKVKPWRLFGFLKEIMQMFEADGVDYVAIARRPKVV